MDFFEFYSDDDEEIVEYINRSRHLFPRSDLFNSLPEDEFVRRFRLSKATTLVLLQQIETNLKYDVDRITSVTPMNQLLCTLRFFATGSHLKTCGAMIGAHESTACRIVRRVTHSIASLCHRYIKFPSSADKQNKLAADFYKIAKFPRVIGAVGCTHVKISSPGGDNAVMYRNRKGYFSINTQCVAAADLSFLDVVARWHGSAHESDIWDSSALKQNFLQGRYNDKFLLGDSGYAQTHYMMTPLSDGSVNTRGEKLYQEAQIKTRNVVETAFGIWKRRFPILSRGISINIQRVPDIIVATAVLHNLAILQNEAVPPEDYEYPVLEDGLETTTQPREGGCHIQRRLLIEGYFDQL